MQVGLYRFYRLDIGRYDELVALCDPCKRGYRSRTLNAGILECVSVSAAKACHQCGVEPRNLASLARSYAPLSPGGQS